MISAPSAGTINVMTVPTFETFSPEVFPDDGWGRGRPRWGLIASIAADLSAAACVGIAWLLYLTVQVAPSAADRAACDGPPPAHFPPSNAYELAFLGLVCGLVGLITALVSTGQREISWLKGGLLSVLGGALMVWAWHVFGVAFGPWAVCYGGL